MIHPVKDLILSLVLGMVIGFYYFYALWWTIRRLPGVQRKVLWLIGSFLIRMSSALAGFYLVMAGRWERLLACLLGFILMRAVFSRRLKPGSKRDNRSTDGLLQDS